MAKKFEVRSGRHVVAYSDATTAAEAVNDYLRALGGRHDEVRRIGTDTASWRGAVYRAVPAPDDKPSSSRAA